MINHLFFIIHTIYSIFCSVYSFLSTIVERKLFLVSPSSHDFISKGFFEKDIQSIDTSKLLEIERFNVNPYLFVRNIDQKDLIVLIKSIFNKHFCDYITSITGFKYSIDYYIFYDREFINHADKQVPYLKSWYSYRWHFDKPNSKNMLKIIFPINITNKHGPLTVIDRKTSRSKFSKSFINNNSNYKFFYGSGNKIYGFLPNVCLHKDGIPNLGLTATQIMFQLNPYHFWSINSNFSNRDPFLNNKINIWTNEPKFPYLAYFFDKRIPL